MQGLDDVVSIGTNSTKKRFDHDEKRKNKDGLKPASMEIEPAI